MKSLKKKLSDIKEAFIRYKKVCYKTTHSFRLYSVATAAFRDAVNADEIERLAKGQGILFEVITPEREAKLAYETATYGKPGVAVVDIGSRSTEFATLSTGFGWSVMATGYRTAFKEYFMNAATFQEAAAAYSKWLSAVVKESDLKILIGKQELRIVEVGEMAAFLLNEKEEKVDERVLEKTFIKSKIKELSKLSSTQYSDFLKKYPLIDKVLPRLVITDFLLEKTGYSTFRVIHRELFAGLISEVSKKQTFKTRPFQ